MQVQYQLNLDDVVAFNLYHFSRSKEAQRRIRLNQLLGIIFVLFIALMWPRWGLGLRTFFFIGYSLFLLLGYPAYYRWFVKRNAQKTYSEGQNKGVLGNHIIALDSDGVIEISDVGETRTTWSGVEKIEANDKYIFLYTGSLMAHIIPRRAFLNEVEAYEFIQMAQQYLSERPRLTSHSTGADSA
jgi:hypothetical protein